jgi:hypothetical protein
MSRIFKTGGIDIESKLGDSRTGDAIQLHPAQFRYDSEQFYAIKHKFQHFI